MRLTPILLLLPLLLLSVAAEDAYTACKCVRQRLYHRTCSYYVRHAVPICAPGADWKACTALCCATCRRFGDYWPVCRSSSLRKLCGVPGDEMADKVGPNMQQDSDPDSDALPSEELDIDPSEEPEHSHEATDIDPTPVPFETAEPSQQPEESSDEGPIAEPRPRPQRHPTGTEEKTTPGEVKPPFDATNEGEIDLTPASEGRPFAPAACECMSRGTACNSVLAAASGVCKPGTRAVEQGEDCKFACCRICTVNTYATYCDEAPIMKACRLS